MFLITTGLQQESKYLVFFFLYIMSKTVLKLKYIIPNIALRYGK